LREWEKRPTCRGCGIDGIPLKGFRKKKPVGAADQAKLV